MSFWSIVRDMRDGVGSLSRRSFEVRIPGHQKGKWDTLKREFSSFVKLVDKQTGVGWDHEKKTIMDDDDWWAEKSKEDPNILKWKHGGPKFVELLDKCFKGAIATGFALYKPYEDQLPCEGS
ncbi:hypothetical protein KIW84_062350 [Lathyrus oleraceus]|uniref:Myb/SANT-like domain-containing protein n=1 Tax=Pisum sativum TaxID=3888 RepID=A0A9D4W674_PEA|nr:hypothetical protein KIW84_062350 [Pisum sativum]